MRLSFCRPRFLQLVECDNLLEYMVRRYNAINFCAVTIPPIDVFYVATGTNTFYDLFDGVFTCAAFGFCFSGNACFRLILNQFLFGCVHREVAEAGTHSFIYASAT